MAADAEFILMLITMWENTGGWDEQVLRYLCHRAAKESAAAADGNSIAQAIQSLCDKKMWDAAEDLLLAIPATLHQLKQETEQKLQEKLKQIQNGNNEINGNEKEILNRQRVDARTTDGVCLDGWSDVDETDGESAVAVAPETDDATSMIETLTEESEARAKALDKSFAEATEAEALAPTSKPQSTSGPVYFNLAVQDEEEDEQHWWGTAAAEATALPAPYPKKKKNKKKKKEKKSQMANPISEEVAMPQSMQAKVTEDNDKKLAPCDKYMCLRKAAGNDLATNPATAGNSIEKLEGKTKAANLSSTAPEWGSEKLRATAVTTAAVSRPEQAAATAAAGAAAVTSAKRWADMAEDSNAD